MSKAAEFLAPAPEPPTALGRYRILSTRAGIRVSPICLGAMSIGEKWAEYGFGAMNKETSFRLLDAYFDAGGNFIDTANNYQSGDSEKFIGEWAEKRGIRKQLVIATKYTMNFVQGRNEAHVKANFTGNGLKSMRESLAESLERLRTDYIDIFYVHWWDFSTSIEEVMDGLHQLVMAGKVLYLGVSDTPAWVVSEANRYAKEKGKSPFVVYQGQWNIMDRSFERDIIPMARAHGMALAPWNVVAGGKLRSDEEEKQRLESGENGRIYMGPNWQRNEREKKMSDALGKVAEELGTKNIRSVAIAYVMQKTTHVFPIIGGRKPEHLAANIEALAISLSEKQIKFLESIVPIDLGFPSSMIGDGSENNFMLKIAIHEDRWPRSEPIKPSLAKA